MMVKLSFLFPVSREEKKHPKKIVSAKKRQCKSKVISIFVPSIEFALTSCAQSTSKSFGISSQDVISGGIRKYTWADDNLSTWNQTSCGHAYLIKSSSFIELYGRYHVDANMSRHFYLLAVRVWMWTKAYFRPCLCPCRLWRAGQSLSVYSHLIS